MLEMKTTADSPGKPMIENAGDSKVAIWAMIPQYCRKLTIKLTGKIILRSHLIVFPAFGNAVLVLLKSLWIVFMEMGYIKQERLSPDNPIFLLTLNLML